MKYEIVKLNQSPTKFMNAIFLLVGKRRSVCLSSALKNSLYINVMVMLTVTMLLYTSPERLLVFVFVTALLFFALLRNVDVIYQIS